MHVRWRRSLALVTASLTALAACASTHQYRDPRLAERIRGVSTIAVVPIDVEVDRVGATGGVPDSKWTAAARSNLTASIVKYFGADGRFVVNILTSELPANAREELDAIRDQIRALDPAVDKHPPPTGCSPVPIPGLIEAAGADALLLFYATDRIQTAGRIALNAGLLVVLSALALMPLRPAAEHAPEGQELADTNGVSLCVVDTKTSEVLWFHVGTVGAGRLTDPGTVDAIVETSYRHFRAASAR